MPGIIPATTGFRYPKEVHETGFAVARLDEIDELDDGREPYRPVRHHFGITAFGVTAWTARETGDRIINEHDESDDASRGALPRSPRARRLRARRRASGLARRHARLRPARCEANGVRRGARNDDRRDRRRPGQPYEPVGWELWAPLRPLYEAGDYAAVADRGGELIQGGARYPQLLYNVACCESLAGRSADALEHLRQAIDLHEPLRSLAREDSDLDPIRDEPAFKELVGS